jgi:hypothetical protein
MDHVQAASAKDGSFLFAYIPTGNPVTINMQAINGPLVDAHWFNPRTGKWSSIGRLHVQGNLTFTPPSRGCDHDWVLVLDAAAADGHMA